jgi:hypothetical protein
MSQVNVINVIAHNAKAPFLTPLSFEIFFEALQPLRHSKRSISLLIFFKIILIISYFIALTWRIVYIGQASDSDKD